MLYRKYRPRGFDEVVGQESVVRAVENALRTGRVAHAYLFSGPHGVGKTTLARLIAKSVNCESLGIAKGEKRVPCNVCASCERYNSGSALDVVEIDAASNRGIDEIRELREMVRYAAAEGGKKTYIIDEVHMLTPPAFNALLKTLEEPPAHIIFVLATTEIDKVPATIISRAQHYVFRRPAPRLMAERLRDLADREGVLLEEEAARLLALIAEGSLRDAEGLLGKIIAVLPERITLAVVEDILGLPRQEAVYALYHAVLARSSEKALAIIRHSVEDGHDMGALAKWLLRLARGAALYNLNPALAPELSDNLEYAKIENFRESVKQADPAYVRKILKAFSGAVETLRYSPIPELPLEIAILEAVAE